MSNKKIVKYNLDPIDELHARLNIIYGKRSNGKSYQVKHKKQVKKYLKTGRRFILMRRWKEEIRTELIEQYYSDVDVTALTQGRYNCITMFKKQLFLSFYDVQSGKTTRGDRIGYVVALSTEQNYAGASYLDVDDITFEEFMSRSEYLPNEPDKLMNFISTVDRGRNKVRVWLVGNTISRVCPYISEWGLHRLVSSQKQGTIETVELPTGTYDDNGAEITVKLAVEYCKDTGGSQFAIGKHKDMINKGAWQSDPQPKLPKSYKCYKPLFRFVFYFKEFKFLCEYLIDKETRETCYFIKPYMGEIDDKTIVVSDKIKVSKYWIRNIYDSNFNNDTINKLLQNFRESIIFYANDITGTDFKQAIDFTIKK